jgi:hypothetical protein
MKRMREEYRREGKGSNMKRMREEHRKWRKKEVI